MVYVWPVTGLSAWTVTVLGVGVCPAIERWIASATLDANAQLVDGDPVCAPYPGCSKQSSQMGYQELLPASGH